MISKIASIQQWGFPTTLPQALLTGAAAIAVPIIFRNRELLIDIGRNVALCKTRSDLYNLIQMVRDSRSYEDQFKELIQNRTIDRFKMTFLIRRIARSPNATEVLRTLLLEKDEEGWTFLQTAAYYGLNEFAKEIFTLLLQLEENGFFEKGVLKTLLLEKNSFGCTFLHYVAYQGHHAFAKEIFTLLSQQEEKGLLEKDVLKTLLLEKDKTGSTFLHAAAWLDRNEFAKEIITLLLQLEEKGLIEKGVLKTLLLEQDSFGRSYLGFEVRRKPNNSIMHRLAKQSLSRFAHQEKQNLIKLLQFLYVHFGNDIEPLFNGEGKTPQEISLETNNDPTISHLFTLDYCNTFYSAYVANFLTHVFDTLEVWDPACAK